MAAAGHFDLASALAVPAVDDPDAAEAWVKRVVSVVAPIEVRQPRELSLGRSLRITVVTAAAAAVSLALGGVVLGTSEASPLRAAEQAIVGSTLDEFPIGSSESDLPETDAADAAEPAPTTMAYRELPQSDHELCLDQAAADDFDVEAVTHNTVTLTAKALPDDRTVSANGVEVATLGADAQSYTIDELRPDTLYVFTLSEGSTQELIACAQTFFAPQEPTPTFSPSDALTSVPGAKIITLD